MVERQSNSKGGHASSESNKPVSIGQEGMLGFASSIKCGVDGFNIIIVDSRVQLLAVRKSLDLVK